MTEPLPWYKRVWAWWKVVAAKIAHIQGHLLLGLIYFLVVTPIAILFRLFGQDPLALRYKKSSSYWVPRSALPPPDEFLKKEF